jgi:ABC-type transporter Mla subunit MlaD
MSSAIQIAEQLQRASASAQGAADESQTLAGRIHSISNQISSWNDPRKADIEDQIEQMSAAVNQFSQRLEEFSGYLANVAEQYRSVGGG